MVTRLPVGDLSPLALKGPPSTPVFDVPRRASRAEGVAQAVEQHIVAHSLVSGSRLGTRRDLVDLLGVAPSTVNEAIKLLEDRGRVATKTGPGGGVFVANPRVGIRLARSIMSVTGSQDEVAEALETRSILEPAVTVSAASSAHTKRALAGIRRSMRAMQQAENTSDFFRRVLDFHGEVAQLCSNEVLRGIYCGLLEIVQTHDPTLQLLPDQNRRAVHARRTKVHQDIADAITAADVAAARAAMRVHDRQIRASARDGGGDEFRPARPIHGPRHD